MADVNQPGLVQKVTVLCEKYNSSSMILIENNAKAFTSHLKQNMCKALISHQLLLLNSNRKLAFYKLFKTETKKSCFFRCNQKSPSQNCYKQISPRESSTPH